jgi:hypothetical protein
MTTPEQKKHILLDYERQFARNLAAHVLDKPKPPLWMIFVPVFFVFFAQKMKRYSGGFEDFVLNYVKPRSLALDAVAEAREAGTPVDASAILAKAGTIPERSHPLFLDWMNALTDHYGTLLDARGDTPQALIRSGYRSKTDYLLQCNVLNRAENAFSESLMPGIEGDDRDIRSIVEKMNAFVTDLRRKEADAIFR